MAPACDLIEGLPAQNVLADKAYDANRLFELVIEQGGDPVIPPKRNRRRQHVYDKALYKERNRVERFSAASNSAAASPPDTTSSPKPSWDSSSSPASCSGSND
jgi:transposase